MFKKMMFVAMFAGLVGNASLVDGQEDSQWKVSQSQVKPYLSKLGQPLVLDAEPNEWGGVFPSTIKNKSYIAYFAKEHEWRGPTDAGMDAYFALTDEGLAVMTVVTDDEVLNSCAPKEFFKQDCIELFFDGRVDTEFMKPPYSAGCFQLLICPPIGDQDAQCASLQLSDDELKKIKIKGKRTPDGYNVEMLLPWELFPGFKPDAGNKMGIQFAVDDYDSRDKDIVQPMMMSWNGAKSLSDSPQKFIEFTLKDSLSASPDTPLDTAVVIKVPNYCLEEKAPIQIELSQALAQMTGDAVTLRIDNWRGEKVFEKELPIKTFKADGSLLVSPEEKWSFAPLADGVGVYDISVSFRDKKGNPAGLAKRQIFIAHCDNEVLADRMINEFKISKYTLPELLTCQDGTIIDNATAWKKKRRPELLSLFETQVYGKTPVKSFPMKYDVEVNKLPGDIIQKKVKLYFFGKDKKYVGNLEVYRAKKYSGPLPVVVGLNFAGNPGAIGTVSGNKELPPEMEIWPIEMIVNRGYALATMCYKDIDPDLDDGFKNGIYPYFYEKGQTRPAKDQWGSIGAWAWGISRIVDYLEKDKNIDSKKIVVMGHSTLGKAALWCGAQDSRIAMVISNDSGAGGAALSKRIFGETVGDLNRNFPHWFCDNFKKYNENETELPVDQHMLIALIAPRPVYIASAEDDNKADPKGEFLSGMHAESVYQLYGKKGLGVSEIPVVNQPVGEFVGYHIRNGGHGVMEYDWKQFLDFADKHFKKKKQVK